MASQPRLKVYIRALKIDRQESETQLERKGEKKPDQRKRYVGNPDNLVSLADRPVEERKAIAMKSAEARKKKKESRMMVHECRRQVLNMPIDTASQNRMLNEFGFTD